MGDNWGLAARTGGGPTYTCVFQFASSPEAEAIFDLLRHQFLTSFGQSLQLDPASSPGRVHAQAQHEGGAEVPYHSHFAKPAH